LFEFDPQCHLETGRHFLNIMERVRIHDGKEVLTALRPVHSTLSGPPEQWPVSLSVAEPGDVEMFFESDASGAAWGYRVVVTGYRLSTRTEEMGPLEAPPPEKLVELAQLVAMTLGQAPAGQVLEPVVSEAEVSLVASMERYDRLFLGGLESTWTESRPAEDSFLSALSDPSGVRHHPAVEPLLQAMYEWGRRRKLDLAGRLGPQHETAAVARLILAALVKQCGLEGLAQCCAESDSEVPAALTEVWRAVLIAQKELIQLHGQAGVPYEHLCHRVAQRCHFILEHLRSDVFSEELEPARPLAEAPGWGRLSSEEGPERPSLGHLGLGCRTGQDYGSDPSPALLRRQMSTNSWDALLHTVSTARKIKWLRKQITGATGSPQGLIREALIAFVLEEHLDEPGFHRVLQMHQDRAQNRCQGLDCLQRLLGARHRAGSESAALVRYHILCGWETVLGSLSSSVWSQDLRYAPPELHLELRERIRAVYSLLLSLLHQSTVEVAEAIREKGSWREVFESSSIQIRTVLVILRLLTAEHEGASLEDLVRYGALRITQDIASLFKVPQGKAFVPASLPPDLDCVLESVQGANLAFLRSLLLSLGIPGVEVDAPPALALSEHILCLVQRDEPRDRDLWLMQLLQIAQQPAVARCFGTRPWVEFLFTLIESSCCTARILSLRLLATLLPNWAEPLPGGSGESPPSVARLDGVVQRLGQSLAFFLRPVHDLARFQQEALRVETVSTLRTLQRHPFWNDSVNRFITNGLALLPEALAQPALLAGNFLNAHRLFRQPSMTEDLGILSLYGSGAWQGLCAPWLLPQSLLAERIAVGTIIQV
jgi:hypothetical protein